MKKLATPLWIAFVAVLVIAALLIPVFRNNVETFEEPPWVHFTDYSFQNFHTPKFVNFPPIITGENSIRIKDTNNGNKACVQSVTTVCENSKNPHVFQVGSLDDCLKTCIAQPTCASVYYRRSTVKKKGECTMFTEPVQINMQSKEVWPGGLVVNKRGGGKDGCYDKKCGLEKILYDSQFENIKYDANVYMDTFKQSGSVGNTISAHECADMCIKDVSCKSFHYRPSTSYCYMSKSKYDEYPNVYNPTMTVDGTVSANKKNDCDIREKKVWTDGRFKDVTVGKRYDHEKVTKANGVQSVDDCADACMVQGDACRSMFYDGTSKVCEISAKPYVTEESDKLRRVTKDSVLANKVTLDKAQYYQPVANPKVVLQEDTEEAEGLSLSECADACHTRITCEALVYDASEANKERCMFLKKAIPDKPDAGSQSLPKSVGANKVRWKDPMLRYENYAYDKVPFLGSAIKQGSEPMTINTCADTCFKDRECSTMYHSAGECFISKNKPTGSMGFALKPGSVTATVRDLYRTRETACQSLQTPIKNLIRGSWSSDPRCADSTVDIKNSVLQCGNSKINFDICGNRGVMVREDGVLQCQPMELTAYLKSVFRVVTKEQSVQKPQECGSIVEPFTQEPSKLAEILSSLIKDGVKGSLASIVMTQGDPSTNPQQQTPSLSPPSLSPQQQTPSLSPQQQTTQCSPTSPMSEMTVKNQAAFVINDAVTLLSNEKVRVSLVGVVNLRDASLVQIKDVALNSTMEVANSMIERNYLSFAFKTNVSCKSGIEIILDVPYATAYNDGILENPTTTVIEEPIDGSFVLTLFALDSSERDLYSRILLYYRKPQDDLELRQTLLPGQEITCDYRTTILLNKARERVLGWNSIRGRFGGIHIKAKDKRAKFEVKFGNEKSRQLPLIVSRTDMNGETVVDFTSAGWRLTQSLDTHSDDQTMQYKSFPKQTDKIIIRRFV